MLAPGGDHDDDDDDEADNNHDAEKLQSDHHSLHECALEANCQA